MNPTEDTELVKEISKHIEVHTLLAMLLMTVTDDKDKQKERLEELSAAASEAITHIVERLGYRKLT